jgi:hypothetical protein
MTSTSRAERVILVSMMKSGTHLINELMIALGYSMYGHVRVSPENRPDPDRNTRLRLAAMVYGDDKVNHLKSEPESVFNNVTDRAWEALAWSWQARFGIPLANLYSMELIDTGLIQKAYHRTAGSSFAETPAGICWVLHEFDIKKIDGNFLREWSDTGEPRVIFNYRDPRDAILSLVNFICDQTKHGLSSFSNLLTFRDILLSKPTMEEKLTFALTESSFPCQAADFMRMSWMLHHPGVCKVSFEELIGPKGGSSAESQVCATARLIDFLHDASSQADRVASALYNPDAFSFYRGRVGAWRQVFTTEHCLLAEERFGEVLSLYGYPIQSRLRNISHISRHYFIDLLATRDHCRHSRTRHHTKPHNISLPIPWLRAPVGRYDRPCLFQHFRP